MKCLAAFAVEAIAHFSVDVSVIFSGFVRLRLDLRAEYDSDYEEVDFSDSRQRPVPLIFCENRVSFFLRAVLWWHIA